MASRGDFRMHEAYKKLSTSIDKNIYIDESKIQGSKYFNDAFLPGKVFIDGKEEKIVLPLRYNAYADVIEIQNGDTIEALVESEEISCTIYGETYLYKEYLSKKGDIVKGYLKLLNQGNNVSFFVKQKAKYKEAKPAKTSHSSSFPAKFVKSETYYFLPSGKKAAIMLNKKSLLKELDTNKKGKMKSFLKTEKINFKKKNDLKRLFVFYNTL